MGERFELAKQRIEEIVSEQILPLEVQEYFSKEAEFIIYALNVYEKIEKGELCKLGLSELRENNDKLYHGGVDITSEKHENKDFHEVKGVNSYLKALTMELRDIIPYVYEQDLENVLIRMELFLEMYSVYLCAKESDREYPKEEELKDVLYFYVADYTLKATSEKIRAMTTQEEDFNTHVLLNSDWSDVRSLYYFGEYVTSVEEDSLNYLNSLPYETVKKMADTFTEGYRIGFEATGKDLSKKKIAEIRYHLGFEPVVVIAVENLRKMGLKPVIRRVHNNLLWGRSLYKPGLEGASVSRQAEFDHKEDLALVFDSHLSTIKLESLKKAFEAVKEDAKLYAGPACMEVFGESPTDYVTNPDAPSYSDEQQKLMVKYTSKAGEIQRQYIIEEERSFTIIAWPTSDIGPAYKDIFDEVIKLNTLDYKLYQKTQQTIIDTLDKGQYVIVKGENGNKTNLRISLHKLENPEKETNFENCVADVNIPVGEVFTSPLLAGTEGVLHVKKVFLEGLEYRDIMLTIKEGMIKEYTCKNFPTEEENKKYIKDNVLYHHESLPMGEFAIGTNTTAYTMARKYDIEAIMPILIAEKTGPHFAFGDTCYSHEEDIATFNPDGKQIVARENEVSALRNSDPLKAYFNCHTDITIPYDELGEVSVVTGDEEVVSIIESGRFVLSGTEVLNEALD